MARKSRFCNVGAGLAGFRAAQTLRRLGHQGEVVLLGEEAEPPYERPPLSKDYLLGKLPRAKLYLSRNDFMSQHGVQWVGGTRVEALDTARQQLSLGDGRALNYDKLLISTGSRPRSLTVPGAQLQGVTTYRSLADADRLAQRLASGGRLLVVGGGFLGAELAAVARESGWSVTLVELQAQLVAPFGPLAGDHCLRLHRSAGVDVRLEDQVLELRGRGRLEEARLASGAAIPCDTALVCVGAEPRVELAAQAGLAVDDGITTDACATSAADVFAAGDVASYWSTTQQRRVRVEHYENAHQQGEFAAGRILGEEAIFDPIPYFWTEQYHSTLQQVGVLAGDQFLRGDPNSDAFSSLHLRDGVLVGILAVNRFRDASVARRLIAAGVAVDPARAADPEYDLRQLLPE